MQGFFEGVKDTNSNIKVHIRSVFDWYDQQRAMLLFNDLLKENIDIVYPAGDGFNIPIILEAKKQDIYAIGYVSDQYEVAPGTVLTSTVQDIEKFTSILRISMMKENFHLGLYITDLTMNTYILVSMEKPSVIV